ncbi:hypothetical protein [Variovorax sp.]
MKRCTLSRSASSARRCARIADAEGKRCAVVTQTQLALDSAA